MTTKNQYSKHLNVMTETAYAEHGSALEMLTACKNAERESLCFGYFHHAKDEYNHTETFLSLLSKYGKKVSPDLAREYRFSIQAIINKGYVSSKGYLIETMNIKDFVAYIYTNELLAKESFEGILKLVNPDTPEGEAIKQIMTDELRHHGLAEEYFLKYYPRLQPWQLMAYRLRETLQNKGRKLYDKNLRFLDKVLSPLYKLMAYLAASISNFLNLKEFDRTGKNLMDISPKSIV
tara:strand:- start:3686 stop:4390 length:705 start_codon:yes stop_codon:yes gene_type:complete